MNAIARHTLTFWRSPSAILVGSFVGVAAVLWWPLIVDTAERISDSAYPVVVSESRLVSRDSESWIIGVKIRKQRDCTLKGIQAYSVTIDGAMKNAEFERLDTKYAGRSLPAGQTYDLGRWKVWPTVGAVAVRMFSQYDCGDGRIITSTLADVSQ